VSVIDVVIVHKRASGGEPRGERRHVSGQVIIGHAEVVVPVFVGAHLVGRDD